MTGSSNMIEMKNKCLYFLSEPKKWLAIAGVVVLGLMVGLKPVAFGVLAGTCIAFILFFRYPELGLFLFVVLIPLHCVMVGLLKLLPGMWKECLLGLTAILWLAKGIANKRFSITRTKINLPLCLFIFWGILLLLVDMNNSERNIIGLRNLLQYSLVFFLAVNLIKDKSGIKKYIPPILIVGVTVTIVNNFLFVFRQDLFANLNRIIAPSYPSIEQARFDRMIPLTFMGAEYYAYYVCIPCCLLIGFLLFARSKLLKVILAIGIGTLVFSGYLAGTRGALLALLVAVMFWGIRYSRKLLFAVIILIFIVGIFLTPWMQDRFTTGLLKHSASDRLLMTRNAFAVASTTPVWGIGLGRVGAVDARGGPLATPHNYYCYLALQTGFVGLIIYLWMMLIFFKTSVRVYEKIERGYFKGFMAGMVVFFITFSVSALFVGSGEAFLTSSFYWLFGGFVMILDREVRQNGTCLPRV